MPAMKIGTASSEKRVVSFGIGMMSRAQHDRDGREQGGRGKDADIFQTGMLRGGAAAA